MATPSTETPRATMTELAEQATERARDLVTKTMEISGMETTDRERELIETGIDLGITAFTTVLRPHCKPA